MAEKDLENFVTYFLVAARIRLWQTFQEVQRRTTQLIFLMSWQKCGGCIVTHLCFNKHIYNLHFALKSPRNWTQSWAHCLIISSITSGFNKPPVCCAHVLKSAWKPNQQREGITLDYSEICIVWNGLWWLAFMNGWFYMWGTSSGLIISTSFCVTSAILSELKYDASKQSKLDSDKTKLRAC